MKIIKRGRNWSTGMVVYAIVNECKLFVAGKHSRRRRSKQFKLEIVFRLQSWYENWWKLQNLILIGENFVFYENWERLDAFYSYVIYS